MDNILISDAERFYIIQGTELGCRLDGRQGTDYRPMELETGILNHTSGSARVRIGQTIVIACVSIEVGPPAINLPNQGRMEIDVECSPTATPKFSGKSGQEIADTLKATLTAAFTENCLPFEQLCIQSGKQCWILHTDLLLLESDGNLLDAASMSIVAALSTLKLPVSLTRKVTELTGTDRLCTDHLPTFVTIHKVGNAHIVDASREEEACSLSRVLLAVKPNGVITTIIKEGCGSLQAGTLFEIMEIGQKLGQELHAALQSTILQEQAMKAID